MMNMHSEPRGIAELANGPEAVSSPEEFVVLNLYDIGRDPDDALSAVYGQGRGIRTVGYAVTHMIPDVRAQVMTGYSRLLGSGDVPVGIGSVYPLGREGDTELRDKYLREHQIKGVSYEGKGLLEHLPEIDVSEYPSAVEVIVDAAKKYGKRLHIVAAAPLTDIAKIMQSEEYKGLLEGDEEKGWEGIGSLTIQGQATIGEDGRLVPDPKAYNIKEDMTAAEIVFRLQDFVPMTLLGKWAAYQLPLTPADYATWAGVSPDAPGDAYKAGLTDNLAASYLRTHARLSLECLMERDHGLYMRLYGNEDDPYNVDAAEKWSYPYDAFAHMALTDPDLFDSQDVIVNGIKHRLIGMTPEQPGSLSRLERIAQHLANTVMRAFNGAQLVPR